MRTMSDVLRKGGTGDLLRRMKLENSPVDRMDSL